VCAEVTGQALLLATAQAQFVDETPFFDSCSPSGKVRAGGVSERPKVHHSK
jgi:hypothetical protein